MKTKILLGALFLLPTVANAEIPYRVEQSVVLEETTISGKDSEAFARQHRFYVGGYYTFSMWDSYYEENISFNGDNTSSFDVVAGARLYDVFRLEANYARTVAKWNVFDMNSDVAMVNAIFDARIDNIYRLFYKQRLVPYIGVGAGISWNSVDEVSIENKITPVASFMAGLGVELGEYFALDFGYRYLYMFSPKFNEVSDFDPIAHQFRVGARVNF